jgi:hypothetical protein
MIIYMSRKNYRIENNNRMYKKKFTIEVSLTNRRYRIAKSLGVPIEGLIGELSPMAKIKRKKENEK